MLKTDGTFEVPTLVRQQAAAFRCPGHTSKGCGGRVLFARYTFGTVGQQVGSSRYAAVYRFRCEDCGRMASVAHEPGEDDGGTYRAHRKLDELKAGRPVDPEVAAAMQKFRAAAAADPDVKLTGLATDEKGVSMHPREMDYLPGGAARRRSEHVQPLVGPRSTLACEAALASVAETPDGLRLVFATNAGLAASADIRDGAGVYLGGAHTESWRLTVPLWVRSHADAGKTITVRVYTGPGVEPGGRFLLSAARAPAPMSVKAGAVVKAARLEFCAHCPDQRNPSELYHPGGAVAHRVPRVSLVTRSADPGENGLRVTDATGDREWAPLAGSTDLADPDNWRSLKKSPLAAAAPGVDADAAVELARCQAFHNGAYPGPVKKQTPELGAIPDAVVMKAVIEGEPFPLLVGVPLPPGGGTVTVREVFGGTITPEAARGLLDGTVKVTMPEGGGAVVPGFDPADDAPRPFLAGAAVPVVIDGKPHSLRMVPPEDDEPRPFLAGEGK